MKGQCKTRWTFIKLLYKNIYSTEIKWHGLIVEKYAFHWPESPFVYIWNKKTYTGHTVRIKITPNSLLELTWKPVIYNKHLKYFVHIVWYKAIENWMRKKTFVLFLLYVMCLQDVSLFPSRNQFYDQSMPLPIWSREAKLHYLFMESASLVGASPKIYVSFIFVAKM